MDKVRIGLIGAGSISHFHALGYQANHDLAQIEAVCDLNKARAEAFAEKYNIARVYTDYASMLADAPLDAVSVAVWNHAHADAAIASLKAGKHVLCEKPLAMNATQAEEMLRTAKQEDKLLMVGFVRRFAQNAEAMKAIIDAGELGDIYSARVSVVRRWGNPGGWFSDKKRSGGGALIDLGVHIIDLARYLAGNPRPVSVYAATFSYLGVKPDITGVWKYKTADYSDFCDVEDAATAMIRFDNGILLQDGPQWIWATTIQDKQLPEFLSRLEQYHVQIGVSQKFSVCQELSGAVHQAQLAASPFWGQSLSVVQECGNSNYKALQLLSQLWGLFYQCNCGQYGWDQFWALYDILMTALQPGEVSFDTITAIHNSLLAMTRSLSESAGNELSFLTLEEINCFAAQGCTFSEKLLDIRLEIQRNLKCGLFISTDDSAGELTDRIAKYLSTHFCDADITVENLAAKFFVSPAYFGQVFKCTYGISITEHINRKRMDYAEYLLTHEALSIKEVSKQVGIPDHYYFSKLYKKYKHMTPGAAKNGRGQITE